MHVRYLWARHPAIAGGNVHHVQAVSSRVIPSPSAPPGRGGLLPLHVLLQFPRRKRPSPCPERALTCGAPALEKQRNVEWRDLEFLQVTSLITGDIFMRETPGGTRAKHQSRPVDLPEHRY